MLFQLLLCSFAKAAVLCAIPLEMLPKFTDMHPIPFPLPLVWRALKRFLVPIFS